jgi:ABC-2 type transport system permease protein
LLVTEREYITRVRKKSFIILTILTPVLMLGMIAATVWFSMQKGDKKNILVVESSNRLSSYFQESETLQFDFRSQLPDSTKEEIYENHYGVLVLPDFDLQDPGGFQFSSKQNPSLDLVGKLENQIENGIKDLRLKESGLRRGFLDSLEANIRLRTFNISGKDQKESHAGVSFAIGYMAAFMIYLFVFIYGAQVMRGIIEEKTSRVVEVIISSVKPFDLMMGKVLGIASVGFTQLFIWIALGVVFSVFGASFLSGQLDPALMEQANPQMSQYQDMPWVSALLDFPVFTFLFSFIFYFLGGYLMYGALFAAIGSAVDAETDSQQFMLPITIPLILAIVSLAPVLNNPEGPLAFWLSMIPLTSPVIMMARIPFGVAWWELSLSMIFLVLGFIFTIWVGSRIYRIGILMHGSKINYKILARWLFKSY